MPSPFPGMNPYLEQRARWQDFHVSFLAAAKRRLVPQVRPKYFVQLERYMYVHAPAPGPSSRLRADLLLARPETGDREPAAIAVLEAPAPAEVTHIDLDAERTTFLEVRDTGTGDVVTVLELLSPSNKDEDYPQYLTRREQILDSHAHLVEIDLLRGGRRMPDAHRPECDYSVTVSRAGHRPRAGFRPIRLSEPLPVIPVPLRPPDADARLDLQEILHEVYDDSGYGDFIYRGTPEPPLSEGDEAWARPFLPIVP